MSLRIKRTALISGASKGIGFSIAKKFIMSETYDYDLVVVARKSEHFDSAVRELKSLCNENQITQLDADFGNLSDVKKIIDFVYGNDIRIDVVVNNAGYTNPNGFLDTDPNDFRHTMEVNLIAPFYLIRELYNHGIHPSHIVNIASTSGIGARPGWLSYAASKAAMISMSDTLREELKVFGTEVICISPGRCATDLRKTLAPNEDPTTIMQPESVAETIHYLTSENGKYITSQNIIVRK